MIVKPERLRHIVKADKITHYFVFHILFTFLLDVLERGSYPTDLHNSDPTEVPNSYAKTAASTPAKLNPKSPLTVVEMAPPPLEVDPVLVGEEVPLDLTDEADPD